VFKGSIRQSTIMMASSMFFVLVWVSQGWATTPLNGPRGLALDAKGNLYVANQNSNQVLVYNPNYVQQTGKSITTGLNEPVGVAFDSKGNVYVANLGSQSILQYSSAGVQNTKFLITNGIVNPWAITIDALDDLYVSNNFADVTVYPLDDTIQGPNLIKTINAGFVLYGIAAHGGELFAGSVNNWFGGYPGEMLAGTAGFEFFAQATSALALTSDKAGNVWVANANGEVDRWGAGGGFIIATVNYAPEGIVVDSARGRVYLSDQTGNQVQVFSTTGTLLHTIQ
jgi:DNA-binding beta-propeller fold protein YncE